MLIGNACSKFSTRCDHCDSLQLSQLPQVPQTLPCEEKFRITYIQYVNVRFGTMRQCNGSTFAAFKWYHFNSNSSVGM